MEQNRPRKLLLGLTGGIAAYKVAELVRLLVQHNIVVQVAMTEAACRFIAPVTLQALSGNTVYTDLWDPRVANNMAHIDLSRDCDGIVIAPASADFMAKIANGLADNCLTCVARAWDMSRPMILAPAMNTLMWEHPATARHLRQLAEDSGQRGPIIVGPVTKELACGDVGPGGMADVAAIVAAIPR